MDSELNIPLSRIAAFIRQHTHDVRNGLNSLDLEISLLRELLPGGEAQECAERVRKQARNVADQMRSLSALFQDPLPIAAPIPARELMLIWREQNAALPEPPLIEWVNNLGDEMVIVDAGMIAKVFGELSANAAAFSQGGPATVTAQRDGSSVAFELREPKTAPLDPSRWGELFSTTRRHGYGTGLWQTRRLLKANGAAMTQQFIPDAGVLATRIAFAIA